MEAEPKVSFIIPLYKAEKFIAQTIDSVLSQTYSDFEVVVIDDCGNDGSVNIIQSYKDKRIRILHNEKNMGIAYSRNRGIKEARGEYIALLDDDDIAMSERLALQISFLDSHSEFGAVGGNAQWIDQDNNLIRGMIEVETEPRRINMFFLFRNIFNNSEMTFRKSIVQENNIQYCDGYYGMEDFHFWIRFLKCAHVTNLPQLLLKKRVFIQNETNRNKTQKKALRVQKHAELQRLSLELNGYVVTNDDMAFLKKFLSEDDYWCTSLKEIEELKFGLLVFLRQAQSQNKDYLLDMKKWFSSIVEDHLLRLAKSSLGNWLDLAEIQNDVFVSKTDWLDNRCSYLESRCAELENWCSELQRGKDWLEKQWKLEKEKNAKIPSIAVLPLA